MADRTITIPIDQQKVLEARIGWVARSILDHLARQHEALCDGVDFDEMTNDADNTPLGDLVVEYINLTDWSADENNLEDIEAEADAGATCPKCNGVGTVPEVLDSKPNVRMTCPVCDGNGALPATVECARCGMPVEWAKAEAVEYGDGSMGPALVCGSCADRR